ncbi:hypothetical protein Leryth_020459 [Lithospermum erythrorhizon]|nr:hypothetical protein Leryth_020459 [Lithospermum erythrorhizon]
MALSMIFERGSMFDLIISEIDMPGMDGFEFLKQITSKVDIPLLLISTMEDIELTRRSLNEGACFFFHKPIAPHNLVNIWQHVLRYRMEKHPLNKELNPREVLKYFEVLHGNEKSSSHLGKMPFSKSLEMGNSRMIGTSTISIDDHFIGPRNGNYIGESCQLGKRVREDDGKFTSGSSTSSTSSNINKDGEKQKKKSQRLDWTPKLQQKFEESYEALGENRATPTRIKQLMNVPEITTQHISSYLQKFRAKTKAQKDEATKHEMPTNMPNSTFTFQRCLGSYPSSMYSSRQFSRPNYSHIQTTGNLLDNVGLNYCNIPTEYPIQIVNVPNSMSNSSNIVTQGNFGPGLQPLEPFLPTWVSHSPNTINLRENIGVSSSIPGQNPQAPRIEF